MTLIQPLVCDTKRIRTGVGNAYDPTGKGRIFFTVMLTLTKYLKALDIDLIITTELNFPKFGNNIE